jgi:hypothetical protein
MYRQRVGEKAPCEVDTANQYNNQELKLTFKTIVVFRLKLKNHTFKLEKRDSWDHY